MSVCPRCGARYDPLRCVGRWECMWHGHTGNFDLHTKRWTCCGCVMGSRGCKRCDHGPAREPLDAVGHFRRLLAAGGSVDAQRLPGLDVRPGKPWRLHFSEE